MAPGAVCMRRHEEAISAWNAQGYFHYRTTVFGGPSRFAIDNPGIHHAALRLGAGQLVGWGEERTPTFPGQGLRWDSFVIPTYGPVPNLRVSGQTLINL